MIFNICLVDIGRKVSKTFACSMAACNLSIVSMYLEMFKSVHQ